MDVFRYFDKTSISLMVSGGTAFLPGYPISILEGKGSFVDS
jgi:hypothetical protein